MLNTIKQSILLSSLRHRTAATKADMIVVNNIKLPVNASIEEAFSVAREKLKKIRIDTSSLEYRIVRRSVDARKKSDIAFVYSVGVIGVKKIPNEKIMKANGFAVSNEAAPVIVIGDKPLSDRPLVVGSGPCGLFAALMLAENGYKPILIERGSSVEERKAAVERLNKFGILDKDTNIQFGAGGAGTFSDGKLITRIQDQMSSYIMRRLVEFGAPEEITYYAKPHVGTDILSGIVDAIISRIVSLGGDVRYNTKLIGINDDFSGNVTSVLTNNGEIPCGALILAIGHSARDTYECLMNKGIALEPKPFSVGMRIEHLAENIDRAMYGDMAGCELLGHAEYALAYNTKQRGVYTFCMCPGGEVVAATSEEGGTVVNGMSEHKRNGRNSNSAVVCSIFKEDYGNTPTGAINFQRQIERAAFSAAGGEYRAPIITVGDFFDDKCKSDPTTVIPTYRGGNSVKNAPPASYLPDFVCSEIKDALIDFDRKISGFADKAAILTGAETRTSAPIRILRNNETRLAVGYNNFYPAGEGAGYAGGITSAAIDGIRTALALMKIYKP